MSKRKRGAEEAAVRAYLQEVDPSWLTRENVDRRDATMSVEEFIENYERPGKPVIIRGLISEWAAATEWTRQRLLERFGDVEFRISATHDSTLSDYLAYAAAQGDERPEYLFDKDFLKKCPEMTEEFAIPKYFSEDLMACLDDRRPDYRWLIVGPRLSGSSFHVDPNANSAWNATIEGSKKWILYPPGTPPPRDSEKDRQICLPEWFHRHYDDDENVDVRYECVTKAGDLMFVPRGWWHCVMNLELSVALTHNVVSERNLAPFVEFLDESSLSCPPGAGCRGGVKFDFKGDVPTSVIFPSHEEDVAKKNKKTEEEEGEPCACSKAQRQLSVDFREALERRHPGLLEQTLQEAQKRSSTWAKLGLQKGDEKRETQQTAFSFNFGGSSS